MRKRFASVQSIMGATEKRRSRAIIRGSVPVVVVMSVLVVVRMIVAVVMGVIVRVIVGRPVIVLFGVMMVIVGMVVPAGAVVVGGLFRAEGARDRLGGTP